MKVGNNSDLIIKGNSKFYPECKHCMAINFYCFTDFTVSHYTI